MSAPSAKRAKQFDVRHYLELPYTRELVREDDGTWFARILELPGCMTVGETQQEALGMLDDAMAAWLRVKIDGHEAIPEPAVSDDFSGRFVVRVTRSLHRDLVRAAERNGVSLNLFVATTLAQATGQAAVSAAADPAVSYLKLPRTSEPKAEASVTSLVDERGLEVLDFQRIRERYAGQTHAPRAQARALGVRARDRFRAGAPAGRGDDRDARRSRRTPASRCSGSTMSTRRSRLRRAALRSPRATCARSPTRSPPRPLR